MAAVTYQVEEASGTVRADKYLATKLNNYSRAALQKLFVLGKVTKDDGQLIKIGQKLKPLSKITVDIDLLEQEPEVIELPVLYEDMNVVVVDKPAGIISHARGRFWQEASVASFIRSRLDDQGGDRAGIVHRLDRATSGVMICAKNVQTLAFLQQQFSARKVEKTYIAVVAGKMDKLSAVIDMPIGRDPSDPKKFKVGQGGKSSTTHYKVIKESELYSLIELSPKTGRTHQLRVHLHALGHPIVGDQLYSGPSASRLMLHAQKLKITMPGGKHRTFRSSLPAEFKDYA